MVKSFHHRNVEVYDASHSVGSFASLLPWLKAFITVMEHHQYLVVEVCDASRSVGSFDHQSDERSAYPLFALG